jgi:hypothetical protein
MVSASMRRLVFALHALFALAAGCAGGRSRATDPAAAGGASYFVRADQLGYLPGDGDRFAVVVSAGRPAPHYRIYREQANDRPPAAAETPVAEGTAGPRVLDTTSRAGTRLSGDRIDLSHLPPANYVAVLDDGTSTRIAIGNDVYAKVLPLVGEFLAEQRCGPTTKAISKHDACHLYRSIPQAHSGDGVAVDDGKPPPYPGAPPVDVEGGWHDAGDYIKFTGTTAYALSVELMALRDHAGALGAAGDAFASELRWGLDWLLKMVAGPELYHQVGGEGDHDPGWRLPDGDTQKAIEAYDHRPVFRMAPGRGRNILGRSAAAFAFGSQVYKQDSAYSARLLAAAKKTYALAKERSGVQNPDPPDFYEEETGDDDLVFGAAALARATGDPAYAKEAHALGMKLHPEPGAQVGWHSVDAVALLEAARAQPTGSTERGELGRMLDAIAAPLAATARTPRGPGAAFGSALDFFGNNSIPESLGAAATCAAARSLNGTPGCDVVAHRQLHWVFGENPFGISYLVGAGTRGPQNVHHSFGQAAHVAVTGALAGGPTALRVLENSKLPPPAKTDPFAMWSTDDLLYEDRAKDYVCNEPAIDFAAALVYTLAEISDAS